MKSTRRYMKLLLTLIVFIFGLSASSCSGGSDDDGGSGGSATSLTVSTSALSFVKDAQDQPVSVQCDGEWSISGTTDWCTVTATYNKIGQANAVVKFNVSVTANDTYDDRACTLNLTAGSITKTIQVTQSNKEGMILANTTQDVDAAGGLITVKLQTTGDFAIESDDWINQVNTKTLSDSTMTFNIGANYTGTDRTGAIKFTLKSDNTISQTLTIKQSGSSSTSDMSISATDLAKDMYPGWNLGNTLEAGSETNNDTNIGTSTETYWQSTKTTQAIINYVKAQGFKSIRIPCSWVMGHITDSSNSTIDEAWMTRVQYVVDYCLNAGLYVIINDHYDGGWLEKSFSDVSDATVTSKSAKLKKIWTQIANHFKNYDERLIFAGLNEPGMNEISTFNTTTTAALIKYEQAFIDAVRSTGGNNAKRVLVVQGPETNIDQTYNLFDVTKLTDTASNRLMVEVHFYDPWQFSGMEKDESWGKMYYYWGTGNDGDADRTTPTTYTESYVNAQFAKMKSKYVDNGYPVIIGEYGANWRFSGDAKHNASIKAYYKAINMYAINNGCVPFAWDTNYIGYPSMTIINRSKLSIYNSYMLDGITSGISAGTWYTAK